MDAIDTLIGRDEQGRWVGTFVLRGRRWTHRAGMATFGMGFAILPVWNDQGRPTVVRVHATDTVHVETRATVNGREVPEAA